VTLLHLPDADLRGNSHFMFSDLNNVEVADQLLKYLSANGLDVLRLRCHHPLSRSLTKRARAQCERQGLGTSF
jgi:hypothetical protein